MVRVTRSALVIPALSAVILAAGCSPTGPTSPTGITSPASSAGSSTADPSTASVSPSSTPAPPVPTPSPTPTGSGVLDWPTYHRTLDRAGAATGLPGGAPARRRVDGPAGRRRVREPLVVGTLVVAHRGRHGLRAGPRDRPGPLEGQLGAPPRARPAVRQHRPARDHRHARVRRGHGLGVRRRRDGGRAAHPRRARRPDRPGTVDRVLDIAGRARTRSSSAERWRSPTDGCTCRSAGCTATAATTSGTSPPRPSTARARRPPTPSRRAREGGIWAPPGVAVDAAGTVGRRRQRRGLGGS